MLCVLLILISVILTVHLAYSWVKKLYYFKIRHIPSVKPNIFLVERVEVLLQRCTQQDIIQKLYNSFPDARVIGYYKHWKPTYLIRDPELLKQITVTSFDHFEDHAPQLADDGIEDLFGNGLVFLNAQKWRDMRATLSPAFSSSKMKHMLHFVSECAVNMTQHLHEKLVARKCVNIEMKELSIRCINDVISSVAFGVHVDSFRNDQNEIFLNAQRFLNFSGIRFVFLAIMPKLMKALGVNITPSGISKFFRPLVIDTIEIREKNNIFRPDMINIIMEVRKGNVQIGDGKSKERDKNDGFAATEEYQIGRRTVNRTWTDTELIAQCFMFYIAGLDSSSVTLSALTYEMAVNPDIQQKLYKELSDANEQLRGHPLDYDTLQKLKYLDQVVSETLRKWPPIPKTDRLCVKDFHFDDGITKLNIEKGVAITVPIHSIHHDPKYFPNPNVFDPERFSDENKQNINPGTFVPFGFGPRSCIGSRFALMQVKVMAYHLLLNFELAPNGETQIPLKFKKQLFRIGFEEGVKLEIRLRQK